MKTINAITHETQQVIDFINRSCQSALFSTEDKSISVNIHNTKSSLDTLHAIFDGTITNLTGSFVLVLKFNNITFNIFNHGNYQ